MWTWTGRPVICVEATRRRDGVQGNGTARGSRVGAKAITIIVDHTVLKMLITLAGRSSVGLAGGRLERRIRMPGDVGNGIPLLSIRIQNSKVRHPGAPATGLTTAGPERFPGHGGPGRPV